MKKKQRHNEYLSHQMKDIQHLTEELRVIDRKLRALHHIIAVKSHPATVKKIFFQGYTPGERIDFRGIGIIVKPALNGHSKIDKTKVLKTNGSLMVVKSNKAICDSFDLH